MGTYAAYKLSEETKDLIQVVSHMLQIPQPIPRDELHCTLLYSKIDCPFYEPDTSLMFKAKPAGWAYFHPALVILLDCHGLCARHDELMVVHGASYDFPLYRPHIALTYTYSEDSFNAATALAATLPPFKWDIILQDEFKEELRDA